MKKQFWKLFSYTYKLDLLKTGSQLIALTFVHMNFVCPFNPSMSCLLQSNRMFFSAQLCKLQFHRNIGILIDNLLGAICSRREQLARFSLQISLCTFLGRLLLKSENWACTTKKITKAAPLGTSEVSCCNNADARVILWTDAWFNFTCYHPPRATPGSSPALRARGWGICLKRSCPGGRGAGQIENNFSFFLWSTSLLSGHNGAGPRKEDCLFPGKISRICERLGGEE